MCRFVSPFAKGWDSTALSLGVEERRFQRRVTFSPIVILSARGSVAEGALAKDLLLTHRVPHPFALFAKGWDSTALSLGVEERRFSAALRSPLLSSWAREGA